MSKPTPGPWYVQDGVVRGDYGIVVETAFISDANARLIAAAPEMLEACLAAIKYNEAITGRARTRNYEEADWGGIATGPDLDRLYNDWMTKAFAAASKAEGWK